MTSLVVATVFALFFLLAVMAWRRYIWSAEVVHDQVDTCRYSLTDVFDGDHIASVPHQKGVRWLTEEIGRAHV